MAAIAARPLLLLALIAAAAIFASSVTVEAGEGYRMGWIPAVRRTGCQGGTIGGCFEGEEFEMENEINRRILATSQYISYGALKRDSTPCSRRGASYYNCRPGAQANPYSRGCSAITRCRRG
ncbi:Rapid alkalinization factor [Acorus calamus]|uniref:Rapid alkalinization factor n=1 Tax=Acorus calamus TaxID=4465 RepID=A0AAV9D2I5_ACOCL|nr:Rapid alkalinization factor [Acorus calamus]